MQGILERQFTGFLPLKSRSFFTVYCSEIVKMGESQVTCQECVVNISPQNQK